MNERLVQLIPATLVDYATIQNMARFYVYDRTNALGWECPEDGLFECIDFKEYLDHPEKCGFLIRVQGELAGFVLLDKVPLLGSVDWNMGEFFILRKFQGKGIGTQVALEIFKTHPGRWSVAVMPENRKAVSFWRRVLEDLSPKNYREVFKTAEQVKTPENPDPYPMNVLSFEIDGQEKETPQDGVIRRAVFSDIPSMVSLSYEKRRAYEKVQPQFWRHSPGAEEAQSKWFETLLKKDDHILLVAEQGPKILGFVIGRIMDAPEVYDPGGKTLMVDDFCVASPRLWKTTGEKLFAELKRLSKEKGVAQAVVVSGAHDEEKSIFLKHIGLNCASKWYVGDVR